MDGSKTERQRARWVGRRRIRSVTGATAVAGTALAAALAAVFAGEPNATSATASSSPPGLVAQPVADTGSWGLSGWGHSGSRYSSDSDGGIAAPTQPPGTSAGGASHAGSGAS